MGQMVLGILLGCKVSPALQRRLYGEEAGLLSDWNNKQQDRWLIEPVLNDQGKPAHVIGLWILCGTGEKAPDVDEPLELREVEKSKDYKLALRQWKKFRNWSRRQHAKVPSARLFVAKTEVA
jgi:hypothetical protein